MKNLPQRKVVRVRQSDPRQSVGVKVIKDFTYNKYCLSNPNNRKEITIKLNYNSGVFLPRRTEEDIQIKKKLRYASKLVDSYCLHILSCSILSRITLPYPILRKKYYFYL